MTTTSAKLLFHSPCFDGIVSAVLTCDYLRTHRCWADVELQRVNYDVRAEWTTRRFEGPLAIVDFLFHPDAEFWADHHRTTFLSEDFRRQFESVGDDRFLYDACADSCAGLLWRYLGERSQRNERYADLVAWAEKIDAARYDSVDEAFSFDQPALQISLSLGAGEDGYCEWLARELSVRTMADVATLPRVHARFAARQQQIDEGLERFRRAATLSDDIVIYNVDARGTIVSRYAPYRFFPQARYSIGYTRGEEGGKITAMRNPWLDFESVPLGEIFTPFGGGGHQRVASLIVKDHSDAASILRRLVEAMEEADRASIQR